MMSSRRIGDAVGEHYSSFTKDWRDALKALVYWPVARVEWKIILSYILAQERRSLLGFLCASGSGYSQCYPQSRR